MRDTAKSKIFGIGFSKTGTTSLNRALGILGYKTIAVLTSEWPPQEPFDAATQEGIYKNFQQCDALYPNSRFICTIREPEEWLRSFKRQISYNRLVGLPRTGRAPDRHYLARYQAHMDVVRAHFESRPADILFLNICNGEGWEMLCPFLGVAIPNLPFPSENVGVNPRVYYQRMIRKTLKRIRKVPKRLVGT